MGESNDQRKKKKERIAKVSLDQQICTIYLPTLHFNVSPGHTSYRMKANVDIPMGLDKDITHTFVVNHINNLNKDNSTLEKVEKQQTKTFGMLCCESGPVSLNMVLNKNGFVCGEKIKISARVINFPVILLFILYVFR